MSALLFLAAWLGIIVLAIKGLVTLWFMSGLVAVLVLLFASPLLPLVGLFSLLF
jgi:hypothetical protein